ncbi:hypothetical protein [Ferrimonas balearica]|uniref:hypothetical protein n=1 Tax=Ferrimonas balearica TaxID=44012 RepID=UPI001C948C67|nr:hypothetical protein [Ferrimonas balearica]MBY5980307.1 hypothetical protein [Ferrimonas balearica]
MSNPLKAVVFVLLGCGVGTTSAEVAQLSWPGLIQGEPQCSETGCWHHWQYQLVPDGQQLMTLLTALAEHTDAPLALTDEPRHNRLSLYLPHPVIDVQGVESASSCLASACAAYEAMAPNSR